MRPLSILFLMLSVFHPAYASAATCDTIIEQAPSKSGDALISSYSSLIQCDAKIAAEGFDVFMRAAGDLSTLTKLALSAIKANAYTPVWHMPSQIKDYSMRDEISKNIGAQCNAHKEVVPFLQGAYYGLSSRKFGHWKEALIQCDLEPFVAWVEKLAVAPPEVTYDEKYSLILDIIVDYDPKRAMELLEQAALAVAGRTGPLSTIIEHMEKALKPAGFGTSISDEDQEQLHAVLLSVTPTANGEQIQFIADRIYQAGDEATAASLLPLIFPTRVLSDKTFLYGVASIEQCEGMAVLHFAHVKEASTRWSILDDLYEPARSFKSRLKCQTDETWPVFVTTEPLNTADEEELESWAITIRDQHLSNVEEVKMREEKRLTLN